MSEEPTRVAGGASVAAAEPGVSEEFSVWVFGGATHWPVARHVSALRAIREAAIASKLSEEFGDTERVIITDGGDCTIFEWERGKGVIWPQP